MSNAFLATKQSSLIEIGIFLERMLIQRKLLEKFSRFLLEERVGDLSVFVPCLDMAGIDEICRQEFSIDERRHIADVLCLQRRPGLEGLIAYLRSGNVDSSQR